MNVLLVSPLLHLSLDTDETFTEYPFYFVKGQNMPITHEFIEFLGTYSSNKIHNNWCLCIDDILEGDDKQSYLHKKHSEVNSFSLLFWLIRDNSVCNTFLYYSEMTGELGINIWLQSTTNSSGVYETTHFSKDEIDIFYPLFLKLKAEIGIINKGYNPIKSNGYNSSHANYVPYNEHNRLSRAIHFIDDARTQSFLPKKISLFIVALEALFSDVENSDAISYKIRYRIPKFLGKNPDEREAIFNQLKLAYNVRSSYLHGDMLKKGYKLYDQLKPISNFLDSLLREIVVLLLNDDNKLQIILDETKFKDHFHQSFLHG